jgi:hypothetical protein
LETRNWGSIDLNVGRISVRRLIARCNCEENRATPSHATRHRGSPARRLHWLPQKWIEPSRNVLAYTTAWRLESHPTEQLAAAMGAAAAIRAPGRGVSDYTHVRTPEHPPAAGSPEHPQPACRRAWPPSEWIRKIFSERADKPADCHNGAARDPSRGSLRPHAASILRADQPDFRYVPTVLCYKHSTNGSSFAENPNSAQPPIRAWARCGQASSKRSTSTAPDMRRASPRHALACWNCIPLSHPIPVRLLITMASRGRASPPMNPRAAAGREQPPLRPSGPLDKSRLTAPPQSPDSDGIWCEGRSRMTRQIIFLRGLSISRRRTGVHGWPTTPVAVVRSVWSNLVWAA